MMMMMMMMIMEYLYRCRVVNKVKAACVLRQLVRERVSFVGSPLTSSSPRSS